VSNLQVKGFPDELHGKLRDRARAEHMTVSDYVARLIERDLAWPSMAEWIVEVGQLPRHGDIDVTAALERAREDYADR
jgi:hypothetical protein